MKNEKGFTIIEVIIAVIVLSVGLLGLASTSALVTRMIAQGHRYTEIAAMGQGKLEELRVVNCTLMTPGSEIQGKYVVAWTTVSIAGGDGMLIASGVQSPTGTGYRWDVFSSIVSCKR